MAEVVQAALHWVGDDGAARRRWTGPRSDGGLRQAGGKHADGERPLILATPFAHFQPANTETRRKSA